MADKKCYSLHEEELLSEEVRLYPCLYDKSQKSYKEKDAVKNAWSAVAEKLEFINSGEKAQAIFANLKKRYLKKRNELKLSKKSGTSADAVAKAEKNIKPYQFLAWLDDFVQMRRGKTNIPSSHSNLEELSESEEYSEQVQEEDINLESYADEIFAEEEEADSVENNDISRPNIIVSKTKKTEKVGKKRAREDITSEMEFSVIKSLRDSIVERKKASVISHKEDDANDLFCKSLAIDLKGLSTKFNIKAKHEIRNILFKYQMEDLENKEKDRGNPSFRRGAYNIGLSTPMSPPFSPILPNIMQSSHSHNPRNENIHVDGNSNFHML